MGKVVIVGAGMAGYLLAIGLRNRSETVDITIVTEGEGAYSTKPKLSNAFYHGWGVEALINASSVEMAKEHDLKILTKRCVVEVNVDEKWIRTDQADMIAYDALVFATGAKSCGLGKSNHLDDLANSINAFEDYRCFTHEAGKALSVAIIGSGLVGVEFAHDFLYHGWKVCLFSKSQYPLPRLLPKMCAEKLKNHLVERGLQWVTIGDKHLDGHSAGEGGVEITLDGAPYCSVAKVMKAVGLKTRVDLAKTVGICNDAGNIVIDDQGKTAQDGIWALGDAVEHAGQSRRFVGAIRAQVLAIAENILGAQQVSIQYPVMPVAVKIPSFPICVLPAASVGLWKVEEDSPMCFEVGCWADDGRCLGFVLMGKKALTKRQAWLKRVS